MSEEAPLSREELEARWQTLWSQGRELEARQQRLKGSLGTVEEAIGLRALAQLAEDQVKHRLELASLKAEMERAGGFQ